MAKVEGPLFSMGARGKIADSIVFFPWKGKNVVRRWLKPTNPKSTAQGYVRCAMKAISKFVKRMVFINGGGAADCAIYQACTASAPAGTNWNAYAGYGFLNALQSAGHLATASFVGFIDQYSTSLAESVRSSFEVAATALGMEDFAFAYGYTTNIPAGLQLYFGAISCYQNSIIGSAPYDTHPQSWDTADVGSFHGGMTAA